MSDRPVSDRIVSSREEQYVRCTLCGEVVELRRRTAEDPELMLMLIDAMAKEHAPCEEWKHDPRRAELERRVRLAMRREFDRAERAQRGRRVA